MGTKPPQKRWLRRLNLLRLNRLLVRRMTTTTGTFACRGRISRQRITGSPRRCSTRFPEALGHIKRHQSFTPFRCSRGQPRHSSGVEIPEPFVPCVSRSCSLADAVTQSWIRLRTNACGGPDAASRGASCCSRCFRGCRGQKVLMDSSSSITAMSEELVQALRREPGMTQTAITQAFVGHACVW